MSLENVLICMCEKPAEQPAFCVPESPGREWDKDREAVKPDADDPWNANEKVQEAIRDPA